MLFRRRNTLPFVDKALGWIWPQIGWKRTASYFWHRLQRIPGTPESVAMGFALGLAFSMTPLVGTHTAFALLACWALGGNLLAAFIATFVINPWTAPPVWFTTYYVGLFILGGEHSGETGFHRFIHMFKGLTEAIFTLNWHLFMEAVWPVFLPMLVGSLPVGIAVGVVSYFVLEPIIRAMHVRRRAKFARRDAEVET